MAPMVSISVGLAAVAGNPARCEASRAQASFLVCVSMITLFGGCLALSEQLSPERKRGSFLGRRMLRAALGMRVPVRRAIARVFQLVVDPDPHHPHGDHKQRAGDGDDPVDVEAWSDHRTCVGSIPVQKRHCKESLERFSSFFFGMCCMFRLTATKVPGRKRMVRTAMVFIAELSRRLASARAWELFATWRLRTLSRCAMRL